MTHHMSIVDFPQTLYILWSSVLDVTFCTTSSTQMAFLKNLPFRTNWYCRLHRYYTLPY